MSLYIVADVVVFGILVLCVWRGMTNGLVKAVSHLFCCVGAFICARLFSGHLGDWINNQSLYNMVYVKIQQVVSEINVTGKVEEIKEFVSAKFSFIIRFFHVDLNGIADTAVANQENVLEKITEELASSVSLGVSGILAFVAVFAIAFIILKVLSCLLDGIAKLPALNALNKIGGLLLGALFGAFICWILSRVGVWVATIFFPNVNLSVEQTYLIEFFYNFSFSLKTFS